MTEKELIQLNKIKNFLTSISNRMIQDLTSIVLGDYGLYEKHLKEEITFLDFEINMDGYAVSLYPMDKDWTQLGYKETLKEYPNGFMRDNNLNIDISYYDFENQSDLERMDEFYSKVESNFIKWFSNCWDKAGGSNVKFDFYIAPHDSTIFYNLKTKQWIDEAKK